MSETGSAFFFGILYLMQIRYSKSFSWIVHMKSRSEIYLLKYVLCSNKHDEIFSGPNYLTDSWKFLPHVLGFWDFGLYGCRILQTPILYVCFINGIWVRLTDFGSLDYPLWVNSQTCLHLTFEISPKCYFFL